MIKNTTHKGKETMYKCEICGKEEQKRGGNQKVCSHCRRIKDKEYQEKLRKKRIEERKQKEKERKSKRFI